MIEVRHLTKRYGATLAIDDLSFDVRPGHVTGFLGPNGSGKSTTMRVMLGLDRPSGGTALVNGVAYRDLRTPLRVVGALLDSEAAHPGRSARNHLAALAASNGLPGVRVDEVLDLTGIDAVADRRVREFSLGMRQRLGLAGALLGDPGVVVFDEPVNGLDNDGIRWLRTLLRRLADEGRAVFVSSHLISEMEMIADRLVVIGRGRLLVEATVDEFLAMRSPRSALVRTADTAFRSVLEAAGMAVESDPDGALRVQGADTARIGELARASDTALVELTPTRTSLEDAYIEMTASAVSYEGALR